MFENQKLRPRKGSLTLLAGLLAIVIAAMLMLGKCSHRPSSPFSSLPVRAGGDTVNVAIEMNPAIYWVRGDSTGGRDYEIWQRISAECGVPVKYHPFVPLDYAFTGLEDGTFDVIVAGFPSTSGVRERFLTTEPVYVDHEVLVQRRDSDMAVTQMDLGGDTVWIAAGSPFADRLSNLAGEIGDRITVMQSTDYSAEHLFLLVATGGIRRAVVNRDVALAMLPDYPDVDASLPVSFSQFQVWALAKDNQALCDSINSWLERVNAGNK